MVRHLDGIAVGVGRPSLRGGGAALADHGGRGHLAAGHAVDRVVDEEDRDVLATIRGLHDLVAADGREVAVALVGEDDVIGADALDAGGHGRGTSVGGFNKIAVEVVVSKYRAADRRNTDRLFGDVHFVQYFCNQTVRHAMRTARAVMGMLIGKRLGFLVCFCHDVFSKNHFRAVGSPTGNDPPDCRSDATS